MSFPAVAEARLRCFALFAFWGCPHSLTVKRNMAALGKFCVDPRSTINLIGVFPNLMNLAVGIIVKCCTFIFAG